jgi:hypothetical protein
MMAFGEAEFWHTPLCPAGRGEPRVSPVLRTPLKGGDRPPLPFSLISIVAKRASTRKLPISPLEGEMGGSSEGGIIERIGWRKDPSRS